jgi:hypothetical protein
VTPLCGQHIGFVSALRTAASKCTLQALEHGQMGLKLQTNVSPSEPGDMVCRGAYPLECWVCPHTSLRPMVPAPIDSVSQPCASGKRLVQMRMDFTRAGRASDGQVFLARRTLPMRLKTASTTTSRYHYHLVSRLLRCATILEISSVHLGGAVDRKLPDYLLKKKTSYTVCLDLWRFNAYDVYRESRLH